MLIVPPASMSTVELGSACMGGKSTLAHPYPHLHPYAAASAGARPNVHSQGSTTPTNSSYASGSATPTTHSNSDPSSSPSPSTPTKEKASLGRSAGKGLLGKIKRQLARSSATTPPSSSPSSPSSPTPSLPTPSSNPTRPHTLTPTLPVLPSISPLSSTPVFPASGSSESLSSGSGSGSSGGRGRRRKGRRRRGRASPVPVSVPSARRRDPDGSATSGGELEVVSGYASASTPGRSLPGGPTRLEGGPASGFASASSVHVSATYAPHEHPGGGSVDHGGYFSDTSPSEYSCASASASVSASSFSGGRPSHDAPSHGGWGSLDAHSVEFGGRGSEDVAEEQAQLEEQEEVEEEEEEGWFGPYVPLVIQHERLQRALRVPVSMADVEVLSVRSASAKSTSVKNQRRPRTGDSVASRSAASARVERPKTRPKTRPETPPRPSPSAKAKRGTVPPPLAAHGSSTRTTSTTSSSASARPDVPPSPASTASTRSPVTPCSPYFSVLSHRSEEASVGEVLGLGEEAEAEEKEEKQKEEESGQNAHQTLDSKVAPTQSLSAQQSRSRLSLSRSRSRSRQTLANPPMLPPSAPLPLPPMPNGIGNAGASVNGRTTPRANTRTLTPYSSCEWPPAHRHPSPLPPDMTLSSTSSRPTSTSTFASQDGIASDQHRPNPNARSAPRTRSSQPPKVKVRDFVGGSSSSEAEHGGRLHPYAYATPFEYGHGHDDPELSELEPEGGLTPTMPYAYLSHVDDADDNEDEEHEQEEEDSASALALLLANTRANARSLAHRSTPPQAELGVGRQQVQISSSPRGRGAGNEWTLFLGNTSGRPEASLGVRGRTKSESALRSPAVAPPSYPSGVGGGGSRKRTATLHVPQPDVEMAPQAQPVPTPAPPRSRSNSDWTLSLPLPASKSKPKSRERRRTSASPIPEGPPTPLELEIRVEDVDVDAGGGQPDVRAPAAGNAGAEEHEHEADSESLSGSEDTHASSEDTAHGLGYPPHTHPTHGMLAVREVVLCVPRVVESGSGLESGRRRSVGVVKSAPDLRRSFDGWREAEEVQEAEEAEPEQDEEVGLVMQVEELEVEEEMEVEDEEEEVVETPMEGAEVVVEVPAQPQDMKAAENEKAAPTTCPEESSHRRSMKENIAKLQALSADLARFNALLRGQTPTQKTRVRSSSSATWKPEMRSRMKHAKSYGAMLDVEEPKEASKVVRTHSVDALRSPTRATPPAESSVVEKELVPPLPLVPSSSSPQSVKERIRAWAEKTDAAPPSVPTTRPMSTASVPPTHTPASPTTTAITTSAKAPARFSTGGAYACGTLPIVIGSKPGKARAPLPFAPPPSAFKASASASTNPATINTCATTSAGAAGVGGGGGGRAMMGRSTSLMSTVGVGSLGSVGSGLKVGGNGRVVSLSCSASLSSSPQRNSAGLKIVTRSPEPVVSGTVVVQGSESESESEELETSKRDSASVSSDTGSGATTPTAVSSPAALIPSVVAPAMPVLSLNTTHLNPRSGMNQAGLHVADPSASAWAAPTPIDYPSPYSAYPPHIHFPSSHPTPYPSSTSPPAEPSSLSAYDTDPEPLTPYDYSTLPTPLASAFPAPPAFPSLVSFAALGMSGLPSSSSSNANSSSPSSPRSSVTHTRYVPPSTADSTASTASDASDASSTSTSSAKTVVPSPSTLDARVRNRLRELGAVFGGNSLERGVESETSSTCSGSYYSARSSFEMGSER